MTKITPEIKIDDLNTALTFCEVQGHMPTTNPAKAAERFPVVFRELHRVHITACPTCGDLPCFLVPVFCHLTHTFAVLVHCTTCGSAHDFEI